MTVGDKGKSVAALIVAAGQGRRAVSPDRPDRPKQYQLIDGKMLLARTVDIFLAHPAIDQLVVVIDPSHRALYDEAMPHSDRLLPPIAGADTRQASVFEGLKALQPHAPDYVLIHDGARPFLPASVIDAAIDGLAHKPALLSGLPVYDTVKRVDDNSVILETIDRSSLRTVQTPQSFHFDLIFNAHQQAFEAGHNHFTDDAAVAEWAGHQVTVVMGSADNVKVTTPGDFDHAEQRLGRQKKSTSPATPSPWEIRVGSGFDVHAFEPGDHVILGGLAIPHSHRLKGHSDADVALHTLTDAIYGALADGDIGHHFPPSEEAWRGKDSAFFLKHAAERVAQRQGALINVDLTIICERPKIGPHRDAMRTNIAALLGIDPSRVSVKATTTEGLGFTGRGEGIAAQASVTLSLPSPQADTSLDRAAAFAEEQPFSPQLLHRARALIDQCRSKKLMLTTAESCTGGLIAGLLTSIEGASSVVDRSFVTYSNAAKEEMLAVPDALLKAHGAVSEPVARAMAEGALSRSKADLAVSVTGIAGPGGGSANKPVGLIHFALAISGHETRHRRISIGDLGRTNLRRAALNEALDLIADAVERLL